MSIGVSDFATSDSAPARPAWSIARSEDLYRVSTWGGGYFSINEKGHLVARTSVPRPDVPGNGKASGARECDLFELVCSLKQRGIELPILFRFDGILRDRVQFLQQAFDDAIREVGYRGNYSLVYPLKVNQQRHIVETILNAGKPRGLGLHVGTKAELLSVLPIHDEPGALLLCGGFKDEEYVELALLSRSLGRRTIIVIEQLSEIELVSKISAQLGIQPELGLRIKPSLKGILGGSLISDKSKFGLSVQELVKAIDQLKTCGLTSAVSLMHFHMGSQITSIVAIKKVLREASRTYVELARLCPALCFFDVGGGLAVDYDGSNTNYEFSMNYSVDEYARDVVYAIEEACRAAEIKHPDIISESGRALVAHHSVLIMEAIDIAKRTSYQDEPIAPPTDSEFLKKIYDLYRELTLENCVESLHDALALKEELLDRFMSADLSIVERGYAENILKQTIVKISILARELKYTPAEVERLEADLKDLYFCNFSVFQSIPDSWAVDQLFPVVPIHMLDREPTNRAMVVDLTCDSDGRIGRFIDLKDVSPYIKFHTPENGSPYYVGLFLVGAYQEILGVPHNLFGDSHAVHVNIDEQGKPELTHLIEGDRIKEILGYVQYPTADLIECIRKSVEKALLSGLITPDESAKLQKRYKEALDGYTYLVK